MPTGSVTRKLSNNAFGRRERSPFHSSHSAKPPRPSTARMTTFLGAFHWLTQPIFNILICIFFVSAPRRLKLIVEDLQTMPTQWGIVLQNSERLSALQHYACGRRASFDLRYEPSQAALRSAGQSHFCRWMGCRARPGYRDTSIVTWK